MRFLSVRAEAELLLCVLAYVRCSREREPETDPLWAL